MAPKEPNLITFIFQNLTDEETGCSVGDFTVSSRRRWNYENNCAAIVCYVSTGLATSSTQLTDLSEDFIQRHNQKVQGLRDENVYEIIGYIVNKILKAKSTTSTNSLDKTKDSELKNAQMKKPAIHLKIFYDVNSMPSIDLVINTVSEFRDRNADRTNIAFTVLPASSLNHFSTFLSICGIRHE